MIICVNTAAQGIPLRTGGSKHLPLQYDCQTWNLTGNFCITHQATTDRPFSMRLWRPQSGSLTLVALTAVLGHLPPKHPREFGLPLCLNFEPFWSATRHLSHILSGASEYDRFSSFSSYLMSMCFFSVTKSTGLSLHKLCRLSCNYDIV